MDYEKEYYAIFRIYDDKSLIPKDRVVIYGWTMSKNILTAFLKQRGEKKYIFKKMIISDIEALLQSGIGSLQDYMVNILELKSVNSSEIIHLFMTLAEMRNVEIKIQKMFKELSSLDLIGEEIDKYVSMVLGLDEKFYGALFYLGYRPKEIDALFDDVNGYDVVSVIENAYEGMPCEEYYQTPVIDRPMGLTAMDDVANKIIYSLESFIKVMREDL